MATTLAVMVWRGKQEGAFTCYEVPRRASQTVLDAGGLRRGLATFFPQCGDLSDSSCVVVTDTGAGLSLAREPVRCSRVAPGATIVDPQPA